ncbi:fibronectin type III domain-containing protein [Eggerthella sp. YY7918]|uniref:fibronectin type III domain-containing protein n=1 Tax=Eggerthella sp. (strain YY7918) TaxID=502558 RepID=UPI00021718E7|nr:fibronectin type III domain-containing protein [Eggerthella sp. YY7918]BAK45154.1 hypothetical protein EGYY_20640 [Eggerthella sp. YY7918]
MSQSRMSPPLRHSGSFLAAFLIALACACACAAALVAFAPAKALAYDSSTATAHDARAVSEGSALTRVIVTPSLVTVTDPNLQPILTVTTNVLPADEIVTYQWQYYSEPDLSLPSEWTPHDDGNGKTFTLPAFPEYDDSRYRCVVTATRNGDTKTIISAEVLVTLAPTAPHDLYADGIEESKATLHWTQDTPPPPVMGDNTAYEVEWRLQGGSTWEKANSVKDEAGAYDARFSGTSFSLSNLNVSTIYEWRVRAMSSDGSVASDWSDISLFVTSAQSGLKKAVVTPILLRYDTEAGGDATFTVQTDAPSSETSSHPLTYQWQWKPQGEENWRGVAGDSNFAANDAVLTVYESFASTKVAHGSSYRCIVSTDNGEATSSTAELMHCMAEPVDLDTSITSANAATLSWTDTNDYDGTYTLQYRKVPVATLNASARATSFATTPTVDGGWTTKEGIRRDPSGTTTFLLNGLDFDATYEWQVAFVSNVGGIAGNWVAGKPFQTQPGPTLKNLAVSSITSTTAKLVWTCDAQVKGTFTVEHRAKGTNAWTVVKGLTAPELPLSGLSPVTEYEWRVSHVMADGSVSETASGPNFTTLASGSGSGLGGGGADGDAAASMLASTGDSTPITALATTVLLAFATLAACVVRRTSRRRS